MEINNHGSVANDYYYEISKNNARIDKSYIDNIKEYSDNEKKFQEIIQLMKKKDKI